MSGLRQWLCSHSSMADDTSAVRLTTGLRGSCELGLGVVASAEGAVPIDQSGTLGDLLKPVVLVDLDEDDHVGRG